MLPSTKGLWTHCIETTSGHFNAIDRRASDWLHYGSFWYDLGANCMGAEP
jgi:hypothetical protein